MLIKKFIWKLADSSKCKAVVIPPLFILCKEPSKTYKRSATTDKDQGEEWVVRPCRRRPLISSAQASLPTVVWPQSMPSGSYFL